jgi:hypothetical protein
MNVLTSIDFGAFAVLTCEFNVHKIHFEFLVGFDADQERRTTTGSNHLIWEMDRFEDERKRALEFLEHPLDELCESKLLVGMGVPDVFAKNSDRFGIRFSFKLITSLLENEPQLCAVCDNAIVYEHEFRGGVGSNRMAIYFRRRSMGSPPSMSDGYLRDKSLCYVDRGDGDLLAKSGNLAYFLEVNDLIGTVTVDD